MFIKCTLVKKRKTLPLLEKVEILDIGAEGKAIARHNNMVIFITGVVPGDIVDIRVTRKSKNYLEGVPVTFHHYSEKRVKEFCEHFGTCGGCRWQNLSYKDQLYYKQKQVIDQFQRIGGLQPDKIKLFNPVLPSEKTIYYRNKLEFAFSNKRWLTRGEKKPGETISDHYALGFHVPGRFDKVLNIKKCYLQENPSNEIRLAIKNHALRKNLSFHDPVKHEGFLRNLIIRNSSTGEIMVIMCFLHEEKRKKENVLRFIMETFPQITSLLYVINTKLNDTITNQEIKLYYGKDHITEQIEDLKFRVGPKSFYQTNSEQASRLFKVVRDYAQLTGRETVYDLYTGIGTIAIFLAKNARKVIGIEQIPEAVEDAKYNCELNKIKNIRFLTGDIKDILTPDFVAEYGSPEVVILDPPRTGIHKKAIEKIKKVNPRRIVYVSCNPATQARDISLLLDQYEITNIQPIDMFPHTHHVENVVAMVRENI
jgi:23S rRNA (uracil1939-C5)-methyltransferase